MMLDHLGESAAAAAVDRACMAVDGSVAGTGAIGDAIAAAL